MRSRSMGLLGFVLLAAFACSGSAVIDGSDPEPGCDGFADDTANAQPVSFTVVNQSCR